MTETEEKIILIKKFISELNKEHDKKIGKINEVLLKLLPLCEHSEIEVEKRYVEGGYYDREEYITTYRCKFCGKKIEEEVKYGGFG